MLLLTESRTNSSPLGPTSTENGSIPSLLPSKTVSTVYPVSNFICGRPVTTRNPQKSNIKNTRPSIENENKNKSSIPVFGVEVMDQILFSSRDSALEKNPLKISAQNQQTIRPKCELAEELMRQSKGGKQNKTHLMGRQQKLKRTH